MKTVLALFIALTGLIKGMLQSKATRSERTPRENVHKKQCHEKMHAFECDAPTESLLESHKDIFERCFSV